MGKLSDRRKATQDAINELKKSTGSTKKAQPASHVAIARGKNRTGKAKRGF